MKKLFIKGSTVFLSGPEAFGALIQEHMGIDAADLFHEFLEDITFDTSLCTGECDQTYEMQAHYQRVLADAIDVLKDVKGKTKQDALRVGEAVLILQNNLV